MAIRITNNSTGKSYLFTYASLTMKGYVTYTEFDIPGGEAEDNQALPLGGSGVTIDISWAMKDDGDDKSEGTNTTPVVDPDEQELYWIQQIAKIGITTSLTLEKGSNSYEVSILDWDIGIDPEDPLKNDCNVSFKLSKNLFKD